MNIIKEKYDDYALKFGGFPTQKRCHLCVISVHFINFLEMFRANFMTFWGRLAAILLLSGDAWGTFL